jgi:hypothetical protein
VLDSRAGRAALDDVKGLVGKETVKFIRRARPPNVYRGEVKTWIRNGHIPGAYSIPWKSLVDETNTHKLNSIADLRAVYTAKRFQRDGRHHRLLRHEPRGKHRVFCPEAPAQIPEGKALRRLVGRVF